MSKIILVNAEAGVIPLPDGSVHCHCTSGPYWRLRDYSSKKEEEADNQRIYWPKVTYSPGPGLPEITVPAACMPLVWKRPRSILLVTWSWSIERSIA